MVCFLVIVRQWGKHVSFYLFSLNLLSPDGSYLAGVDETLHIVFSLGTIPFSSLRNSLCWSLCSIWGCRSSSLNASNENWNLKVWMKVIITLSLEPLELAARRHWQRWRLTIVKKLFMNKRWETRMLNAVPREVCEGEWPRGAFADFGGPVFAACTASLSPGIKTWLKPYTAT